MANRTADWKHIKTRGRGNSAKHNGPIADGVTLYRHSLVGINAAGYVDKWANTAGHQFLGLLDDGYERSGPATGIVGNTSDNRIPEAYTDTGGQTLLGVTVTGATQAGVNGPVYCATDNPEEDLTTSATANVKAVGWLSRYGGSTSDCDVTLYTPEEHLALN